MKVLRLIYNNIIYLGASIDIYIFTLQSLAANMQHFFFAHL